MTEAVEIAGKTKRLPKPTAKNPTATQFPHGGGSKMAEAVEIAGKTKRLPKPTAENPTATQFPPPWGRVRERATSH